jgi:hypothetical protein
VRDIGGARHWWCTTLVVHDMVVHDMVVHDMVVHDIQHACAGVS